MLEWYSAAIRCADGTARISPMQIIKIRCALHKLIILWSFAEKSRDRRRGAAFFRCDCTDKVTGGTERESRSDSWPGWAPNCEPLGYKLCSLAPHPESLNQTLRSSGRELSYKSMRPILPPDIGVRPASLAFSASIDSRLIKSPATDAARRHASRKTILGLGSDVRFAVFGEVLDFTLKNILLGEAWHKKRFLGKHLEICP